MGLSLTLGTALSGLNTSQEILSVISNNIANANTEDYARRVAKQVSVSVDGKGAGAKIQAITRQVDDYLLQAVRQQSSIINQSDISSEYFARIQSLLGQPGSGSSLSSVIDKFFSSLQALSTNPELSSLRLSAINDAKGLVSKTSGLATSLEELRYQSDRDIYSSIGTINQKLEALFKLNPAIRTSAISSGSPDPGLVEQRDTALKELSQYIDISVFFRASGEAIITTANGISLLDENQHRLSYLPATSLQSFTNNTILNPITVQTLKNDGTPTNVEETLVSAGTRDSIVSEFNSGKIVGLLGVRDSIIPNLLDQLDNLVSTLVSQFNAVHNDGAGFLPPSSFTGTRPVLPTDEHLFSGKVQIGLVTPDGKPAPSFYGDETSLRPLTLDLAALDNGQGNGRPDVQTIIDEINLYYGPPQQRASLGPLYDIRLASRTNTLGAQAGFPTNSAYTFDLELDNSSSGDATVEVQGVQVLDAGATGLTSALPPVATVEAGARSRTGSAGAITVNFNGVATDGPYTVRLSVKVTDGNGRIFYSDIDYSVQNNVTNAFNDRSTAIRIAAGDATLVPPQTNQRYLTASLVDEEGNPSITGAPGFLKLATNSGSGDYRIALNELDSKELGQPDNASLYPPSNRGFSYFFELNNFFVENRSVANQSDASVANSALNLRIRSDIVRSPNLISLGELTRSTLQVPQEKNVFLGTQSATGTIRFTGNPAPGDQLIINGTTFTFVAIPTTNPNEIEVGASLVQTLTNISLVLNTNNAYTQNNVAFATYTHNGIDTLNVSYDRKGTTGNAFALAVNLTTGGLPASVNGGVLDTQADGLLQGGESQVVTLINDQTFTYELGSGNNQVISRLANLGSDSVFFNASGGLPASSFTFTRYSAEIIGYSSTQAVNADSTNKQNKLLHDELIKRVDSGSGVNIDEELANIVLFQNAYAASARVIKVTGELFDALFDAI